MNAVDGRGARWQRDMEAIRLGIEKAMGTEGAKCGEE